MRYGITLVMLLAAAAASSGCSPSTVQAMAAILRPSPTVPAGGSGTTATTTVTPTTPGTPTPGTTPATTPGGNGGAVVTQPPAAQPPATQPPATPKTATASGTVSTGEWRTGIDVRPGSTVHVTASGVVNFGGCFLFGCPELPPGGDDWKTPSDYPAPSLRKNSLICRVGNEGWRQCSEDTTFTAGEGGELVLMPNDGKLDDNTKGWAVRVAVTPR